MVSLLIFRLHRRRLRRCSAQRLRTLGPPPLLGRQAPPLLVVAGSLLRLHLRLLPSAAVDATVVAVVIIATLGTLQLDAACALLLRFVNMRAQQHLARHTPVRVAVVRDHLLAAWDALGGEEDEAQPK